MGGMIYGQKYKTVTRLFIDHDAFVFVMLGAIAHRNISRIAKPEYGRRGTSRR
jgi:hypothetical protein